jgi:hypothetical protein
LGLGADWQIKDLLNSVHPADVVKVTRAWEQTLGGSGDLDIEYRCRSMARKRIIWARGKVILKKKDSGYDERNHHGCNRQAPDREQAHPK